MENKDLIKYYMNKDNTLDLEKIVNNYSNYIFSIIKNITKNIISDEDIEELISDVILVLWKNREKLEVEMSLKSYIAGVTKNIVKNKLRSLNAVCDYIDIQEDIKTSIDLEEIIESKEEFEIISNELKNIGKDSKIFIMFYCEGRKIKEIASILGYTEFNIGTKLHRVRKKIKQALEKRGYYYGK